MKELTTNIFFCLILALFSCTQNSGKEKKAVPEKNAITTITENRSQRESFKQGVENLPNELLEFVPTNYSVLDTVSGDLNFDEIKDYILVLKKNGEDTLSDVTDNPESRPLLILLRNKDNKLQLVRKNYNTVYCFDCGGMMGDPCPSR